MGRFPPYPAFLTLKVRKEETVVGKSDFLQLFLKLTGNLQKKGVQLHDVGDLVPPKPQAPGVIAGDVGASHQVWLKVQLPFDLHWKKE